MWRNLEFQVDIGKVEAEFKQAIHEKNMNDRGRFHKQIPMLRKMVFYSYELKLDEISEDKSNVNMKNLKKKTMMHHVMRSCIRLSSNQSSLSIY